MIDFLVLYAFKIIMFENKTMSIYKHPNILNYRKSSPDTVIQFDIILKRGPRTYV